MNRNFKELNALYSGSDLKVWHYTRRKTMILITFSNDETLEFQDRFTAEVHVDLYKSFDYSVVKLRCEKSSDYMAIQNYIDLLKLKIH